MRSPLTLAAAAVVAASVGASARAEAPSAPLSTAAQSGLVCDGVYAQGGFAICAAPDAVDGVRVGGERVATQHDGVAFIPFGRDQTGSVTVTAPNAEPVVIAIAPRTWDVQRVDGLPPNKVTARTPEEQRKVAEDVAKKTAAWASSAPGAWWLGGFQSPIRAEYRRSGVFGSQRILNGEPGRVHNGTDFAAPVGSTPAAFVGTDVFAPAGGVVALADPDMYFEGGFVVLDHGKGVMSLFMHLSEVVIETGDVIDAGARIGAVGSTGRSTGPHLHWGLRVAGTYVDPESALSFDPSASAALAGVLSAEAPR